MKNIVRFTSFIFLTLIIILACTKEIGLKTEVEFTLTEQHESSGFVNQNLTTKITVVPEEILEEFKYSYSYLITKGSGYFQNRLGEIFPQGEKIPLNPLSATMMYVGSESGNHVVKITATDNYGFTKDVEIEYTLAKIPPLVWTAASSVKRVELGNSVQITVNFEKSEANPDVTYVRRYYPISGSGTFNTKSAEPESVVDYSEFSPILPGTYTLEFTPLELGVTELSFDLKGDEGEAYTVVISFEVLEDIVDRVIPEITLLGNNPFTLQLGSVYNDPGATALDDVDGDISEDIVIDASEVDVLKEGSYAVYFIVSDASGNTAIEMVRTVKVIAGENPLSPENDILAFAIPGQIETAEIDEIGHTITVYVSSGTETQTAPLTLNVSPNANISPSPTESQDFRKPVTYTVTAENGDRQDWRVIVTIAESTDKSIEALTILGVAGTISGTNISLTLPAGSNAKSLTPTVQFTGSGLSPQNGTTVDFTNPIVYTVTAEDGSTLEYTVTVVIEKSNEKDITNFEIAGVSGVFSQRNISLTLPSGNDEKSLSPSIVHTGASIDPLSETAIDFTNAVVFTVTAENGTQNAYTASVIIEGDKPTAEASASKPIAGIDENINFTGSSSTDDIQIIKYTWDFGDGNTSSLSNPVHKYAVHGDFTVMLTVTDDGGLTDTASVQIEVPNQKPTAVANAAPTTVVTGNTVNFTGNSSYDDAGIVSYAWDFGDGNTSSAANPQHVYTVANRYMAILRVTDAGGLTDEVSLNITVEVPNRQPLAVVSSDKTSGPNILTVQFNGSGSSDPDGDTLSYAWDFGDEMTSSQRNPSHDFEVTGTYTVKLTVSDGQFVSTDTITINVSPFNKVTGRYSAPAGSLVTVKITSTGGGKGSASLKANSGGGETGNEFIRLNTSWNGLDEGYTFLDEDEDSFVMPPSGVVHFFGRHSEIVPTSQTQVGIINSIGSPYNINPFLGVGYNIQD